MTPSAPTPRQPGRKSAPKALICPSCGQNWADLIGRHCLILLMDDHAPWCECRDGAQVQLLDAMVASGTSPVAAWEKWQAAASISVADEVWRQETIAFDRTHRHRPRGLHRPAAHPGTAVTEIIIRSRQGGKTTELIRRAPETGGYIVCTDQRRARQIAQQARDMGLNIPFPLTAREWQERNYHPPGVRGLLFDDLDRIIQSMTAVPMLAATWTADKRTPDVNRHGWHEAGTESRARRRAHARPGTSLAASPRPRLGTGPSASPRHRPAERESSRSRDFPASPSSRGQKPRHRDPYQPPPLSR